MEIVVAARERVELVKFFCRRNLRRHDSHLASIGNLSKKLMRDAFFRRFAVERIVNLKPMDREVFVLLEVFVGEHFVTDVAHLDIECTTAEFARDGFKHGTENFLAVLFFKPVVGAFVENPALAVSNNSKHVCHNPTFFVLRYYHIRLVAECMFVDFHQFAAVEIIGTCERRQVFV